MISWLLAGFPDPSATLRLTLHYVSRPRSTSPTLCSTILMSCRDQSVSAAISYQTSGYCMCGTARYNSHYTFSRENMRWRHPTTPPHHQTLCSKRLEFFFCCVHSFIYHSLVKVHWEVMTRIGLCKWQLRSWVRCLISFF